MKRVVYNRCYGGFSLSRVAALRLLELGMTSVQEELDMVKERPYLDGSFCRYISRHDPLLLQVIDSIGLEACSGGCAKLDIEEIHGDRYKIEEYDGIESVVEPDYDHNEWITIP